MKWICAALVAALAGPVAAEKLPLAVISRYFNDMDAVQGRFSQLNDDGSTSSGRIIIDRPGKMRFEYDAPDSTVVIAGSGNVVILDQKSNEPPESYPLRRTPLWILLAPQVNLGASGLVVGHGEEGAATVVTARDPENPDHGQIRMYFTAEPVALRQWVIDDPSGSSTTIVLDALEPAGALSNRLFDTGRYTARERR